MARKRLTRRVLALAVIWAAALPASALATPSSYDQYVPFTPSASGPTAPGGGHGHSGGTGSVPLTPAANSNLNRVDPKTRALLQQIATSPDLGAVRIRSHIRNSGTSAAPGTGGIGSSGAQGSNSKRHRSTPTLTSSPSAIDAAGDQLGGDPALPIVIVAALGTAVLVAFTRRRHAAK